MSEANVRILVGNEFEHVSMSFGEIGVETSIVFGYFGKSYSGVWRNLTLYFIYVQNE